jgi:hypothetical protein
MPRDVGRFGQSDAEPTPVVYVLPQQHAQPRRLPLDLAGTQPFDAGGLMSAYDEVEETLKASEIVRLVGG